MTLPKVMTTRPAEIVDQGMMVLASVEKWLWLWPNDGCERDGDAIHTQCGNLVARDKNTSNSRLNNLMQQNSKFTPQITKPHASGAPQC